MPSPIIMPSSGIIMPAKTKVTIKVERQIYGADKLDLVVDGSIQLSELEIIRDVLTNLISQLQAQEMEPEADGIPQDRDPL